MAYSDTDILLNDFATRSFRDTADRDYVHARLAYRARLIPQFQWSALHCLEKYAKGMLLLNRIPAKKLRHEVSGALELMEKRGTFKIELSTQSLDFIERLESGARFRYFEVSYSNRPHDLVRLDRAVSEFRRYCQVVNLTLCDEHDEVNVLELMLEQIRRAATDSPFETCISNGWLEKVIKDRKHSARAALVWQNLYFGSSNRKKAKLIGYIEGGNSPLYLHPEILEDVQKYVFFPESLAAELKRELANGTGLRD